jgi:mono/diheme cytochrome c family protein
MMKERDVRSFTRGGLALYLMCLCLAGCQQEMANEPRYKPLAASTFFADGRASRDLVPGTVARGHEPRAGPLYTGRVGGDEATDLPLPLPPDLLARGQERYTIYCTPCHDRVGTGHGMIVQRGYPHPPSFHIPRLRQAPIGHFFVVMSDGVGAMPGYAPMIPVQDRWAIAAYIRTLQLSQYAPVAALPAEVRQALEAMQ